MLSDVTSSAAMRLILCTNWLTKEYAYHGLLSNRGDGLLFVYEVGALKQVTNGILGLCGSINPFSLEETVGFVSVNLSKLVTLFSFSVFFIHACYLLTEQWFSFL